MIQAINLSKSFGARTLFEGLTWRVDSHPRVGLIGPNGAGKSTLLKILAGEIPPDDGEVHQSKTTTVGYLPQEVGVLEGDSALDVVLRGRADLLALADEIAQIERALGTANEALTARLGTLQSRFEIEGGYTLEARAREVLSALGFAEEALARPPDTFSGGWRMRMLLCRLLLQSPDLLPLDEPTNHLDIESMRWLESFLMNYPGTIVMVSHDRAFLNRTITAVAFLDRGEIEVFPGNYDAYLAFREQLRGELERRAELQAKEIAKTQAFIDRFRAKATKAKQVQSRVKALEKISRVETLDSRKTLSFRFPEAPRSGHLIVELRHIAKAYGENRVYEDLNFRAWRGDRVALVGPNGAGKSTMLKILAGVLDFNQGERLLGDRVHVGYFAQHQSEGLNLNNTVLDEILSTPGVDSMKAARGALGAFLFGDDSVDKPVGVLSGGEKNRLALAKLLLNPPNLLVMDEPTNHLDIDSRDALRQAMSQYTGCLILISHDRYFINHLVNKVIHVDAGELTEYVGDFDEYEAKRRVEEAAAEAVAAASASGSSPAALPTSSRKERRRQLADIRSRRLAETRTLRAEVSRAEDGISALEEEIGALEARLADPKTYEGGHDIEALGRTLAEKNQRLEALMESWSEVQQSLEEIDARFDEEEAALS